MLNMGDIIVANALTPTNANSVTHEYLHVAALS